MQATPPQSSFDARGRAIPLPADEERRRADEAIRALDALAGMGDDEEQGETSAALAGIFTSGSSISERRHERW